MSSNLDDLPIKPFLNLSYEEKKELILTIREKRQIVKASRQKSEKITLDLGDAESKPKRIRKQSKSPEELIATLSEQQILELMKVLGSK